ncbi:MAG: flagellar biosynthesis anti-sigma factor FlgM [Dehalococcoidia bacterium]
MSSKIDGFGSKPTVVTGGHRSGGAERTGDSAKPAGGSSSSDSVTLTDNAMRLQRLAQAVADTPVADSSRISSVKDALAKGEYRVNAERVADKILQAERELIGR